ncbi:MAG: tryptophan 2,3-dioxygenase family protein [Ginsengibacter sp.]
MAEKKMYYSDYLKLNQLLNAQHPESDKPGNAPAHDELLFIIVHQAYELWFKQIIYELDYVLNVFGKQKIDDNSEDLNLVRHRLKRVIQILALLNQQVNLIETMTPLDFLEFRPLLASSSGFQSLQFRIVETKLGLKMPDRYKKEYYARTGDGGLTKADADHLEKTENESSLLELLNTWLERMPFFDKKYWEDFEVNKGHPQTQHPF